MASAPMTAPQSAETALALWLAEQTDKGLLRFLTCGSVDDGKSTLIGRLLYDSQLVLDDQLASLRRESRNRNTGDEGIDFSLLVDGLTAEREQGITIDVAYRSFPPTSASSSSPIRRATSSIPATWRRARPTPTSPLC